MGEILVTGGAGFIGSCLVAGLEERGLGPVVVCDRFGSDEKWRNLAKHAPAAILPPEELPGWLTKKGGSLDTVYHLGAISATTERDVDRILAANFRLSLELFEFCTEARIPFYYASSGATYGDGAQGFDDDWRPEALARLRPRNPYGWSKHLFDLEVARRASSGRAVPPAFAGLKFFNVYGPNEAHKGPMRSVAAKAFDALKAGHKVRLFRSHRPDVPDGGQKRDFVWVGDCVDVLLWLRDHPEVRGIFNLGTGRARTFVEFVTPVFEALGKPVEIEYIDTPVEIRDRYQYFTEARIERLRAAGYTKAFTPVEEGVRRYVEEFLVQEDPYL